MNGISIHFTRVVLECVYILEILWCFYVPFTVFIYTLLRYICHGYLYRIFDKVVNLTNHGRSFPGTSAP